MYFHGSIWSLWRLVKSIEVGGLFLWKEMAVPTGCSGGSFGWWKLMEASTSTNNDGFCLVLTWKQNLHHRIKIASIGVKFASVGMSNLSFFVTSMELNASREIIWWTTRPSHYHTDLQGCFLKLLRWWVPLLPHPFYWRQLFLMLTDVYSSAAALKHEVKQSIEST